MNPQAKRRLLAASAALAAYAAGSCATQPAEPHVGTHELEHMDYAQPRSQEQASDYEVRLPRPARAARGQRGPRGEVRGARSDITPRAESDTRTVVSTAYCLTGTMANGERVHAGAVAMNGVPLGSRWEVVGSGRVYVVADRIGHGSQFDIAMPGDCAAARAYGRRTITIRRVA